MNLFNETFSMKCIGTDKVNVCCVSGWTLKRYNTDLCNVVQCCALTVLGKLFKIVVLQLKVILFKM